MQKYYCRDCGKLMDGIEYMLHPGDHWLTRVNVEVSE
jgi:hypothetical protein